jgi:copper resistance protein D
MIEAGLAASRWLQFAATALIFGVPMFALYGLRASRRVGEQAWIRRLIKVAAATGLVAAGLTLSAQAAEMSGDPALALDLPTIWYVAIGTHFGAVWLVRVVLLAAFLALAVVFPRRPVDFVTLALVGGLVAGSLAWFGHGGEGGPALGLIHRIADVLHIFAASIWIGALVMLAHLVRRADAATASYGLSRFSGVGSLVVATLVVTGALNTWAVTQPRPLGEAIATLYAAVLFIKLGLFAAMLGLAALNRFILTPRLSALASNEATANSALARLRLSVGVETTLAALVIAAVAALGVIEPPNAGV